MSRGTLPTVLLLGAQSSDDPLHSIPEELSILKQIFDDNPLNLSYQIEYEPYFTVSLLKKKLDKLSGQIAILHFAGHSAPDWLQTDDELVYAHHIARIISDWTIKPTLVFLNGCDNAEQAQLFLGAGVENIIATHQPIDDHQASGFAYELYTSLFTENAELPLQKAYKRAGEKVFIGEKSQVRSLSFPNENHSDDWDWGLFQKNPDSPEQWTLRQLLSKDRPVLDKEGNLLNPYKGLEAFQETDKVWFYGREELSNKLTTIIQSERFFVLLGASGSGKSSVINAGVVPSLRQDKDSLILQLRPGNAPFSELAKCFAEPLYPESVSQQLKEQNILTTQLEKQLISLPDLVQLLLEKTGKNKLYLSIDQFEELYTQSKQPIVKAYLQQLISLISSDVNSALIIIMRADFLTSALAHSKFAALLNQYPNIFLPPMSKAEIREVIEKPANTQHIQLEPALVAALLDDSDDQLGYLPLLQYALSLLWESRQGMTITLKDYNAAGGLKKAIETKATEIYQSFNPKQQEYCKQIFLKLIQPGEGTEDTRRRASLDEFNEDEDVQAILKQLADARLITTQQKSKTEHAFAEVSHEALIKHWSLLRGWIAENRDELRIQHQITEGAREWDKHKRDKDWLLSGSRLAVAEDWMNQHLSQSEEFEKGIEFIQSGIKERDRKIKKKEKQRKRNRNVMVAFMVVLSLFLFLSLIQRQEVVSSQKKEVDARILADQKTEQAIKAKEETERKRLVGNYFLAKTFEQKALTALGNGDDGDKDITEYQKAWLYALEAEKLELPTSKVANNRETLFELTKLSVKALSPQKKQTPYYRAMNSNSNSPIYSPDGKTLASASYNQTIQLWDASSGEHKQVLMGHLIQSTQWRTAPMARHLLPPQMIKPYACGMPVAASTSKSS